MKTVQKTLRNSTVELLRILAMLMIVLSHICCHSGFDYVNSIMTVNRLFVQFGILGNLGVDIFVLISGYYLCRKSLTSQSVSRLLSQVWFYSIAIFLVCRFGFQVTYSGIQLQRVFFPTIYDEYWFFTAYFVLTLLTPFLNKMIRTMNRRQFQTLLVCMTLVWVMAPTLTKQQMYGSEIPQFLYLYLLGAYIREYPENIFRKKWVQWGCFVGGFLILYALTVGFGYLERYSPEAFGASKRFYNRNSLLIISAALGMFAIAVYSRPFTNSLINTLSGCTFGVYLIHDNPVIRSLLWKDWLHWGAYFTSGSFIPRLIVSVLLVYTVCTAIEWLRQKTVAKPLAKLVDIPLHRLMEMGDFL